MDIKELTKIYTAEEMDRSRKELLCKVGVLNVDVTTPLKDRVNVVTCPYIRDTGERAWETIISGGPHEGEEQESHDLEAALIAHWTWVHRLKTGRHVCTDCDGTNTLEFFQDVWTNGGHDTEHWTADCKSCDDDGLAMDEDVTGTYIQDGELVE